MNSAGINVSWVSGIVCFPDCKQPNNRMRPGNLDKYQCSVKHKTEALNGRPFPTLSEQVDKRFQANKRNLFFNRLLLIPKKKQSGREVPLYSIAHEQSMLEHRSPLCSSTLDMRKRLGGRSTLEQGSTRILGHLGNDCARVLRSHGDVVADCLGLGVFVCGFRLFVWGDAAGEVIVNSHSCI